MTKRIAVRLPDDLVEFLDTVVESGDERSPGRSSVLT
jgi:Arc/MetJ-type ribon-helix-helix transcriptional regulator